jgi:tungstate transport system substrate-binding protein
MKRVSIVLALLALSLSGFAQTAATSPAPAPVVHSPKVVLMATTTSTDQSGLLDILKPAFEKDTGYTLQWVAVGTGQSLKIGEKGDCDVVLVHARGLEDTFMAAGFGLDRKDVMYNDFILLGPANDPAGIAKAASAVDAFGRIFKTASVFISRGDASGTDVKEKELWKASGLAPKGLAWYREIGQGMTQAIQMAEQVGGYTIADRATWLKVKDKFKLTVLYQGDKDLFNPYGVITVNPAKWPSVNIAGAKAFMDWITGPRGQALIAAYKLGGEQLFYLYK